MFTMGVAGLRRGMCFVELTRHLPDLELVAVCEQKKAVAEDIAKRYAAKYAFSDYDEFVKADFDIAVVATPLPFHVEHCVKALDAGKHVVSEVPAANSLEQCRLLLEAVRRSKGRYFFAENMNYFPFVLQWKKMVDDGMIGKVFYAEVEYVHDCRGLMRDADGKPTWRASMPPIQYCTHSLGPLLWILRDRCVSVSALHTGVNVAPELGAIDMEVAILKTANGAVVKLLCGFSVEREPPIHWHCLYGTKGVLETKRCGWDKHKGYFSGIPHLHDFVEFPEPVLRGIGGFGHGGAEILMMKDFLRSLVENTRPPFDIYDALDCTMPGLYAHESAKTGGQPVAIPDPRTW